MRKLARHAGKALVVAGYDAHPAGVPDIVFFHEPLEKTLDYAGMGHRIRLGDYKQTVAYLAARGPLSTSTFARAWWGLRLRACAVPRHVSRIGGVLRRR